MIKTVVWNVFTTNRKKKTKTFRSRKNIASKSQNQNFALF